jgi:hypothetical protein
VSLVYNALLVMLIIAAFKFVISRIPPIAAVGAYL